MSLSFADLVAIQAEHLAMWKGKLVPEVFAGVEKLCLSQNKEFLLGPRTGSMYPHPTQAGQSMRVWRGQDLIEIIRQWPTLKEPYLVEDDCI